MHVTSAWLTACGSTRQEILLHYTRHVSSLPVYPLRLGLAARAAQGQTSKWEQISGRTRACACTPGTDARALRRSLCDGWVTLDSFNKSDKSSALHLKTSEIMQQQTSQWRLRHIQHRFVLGALPPKWGKMPPRERPSSFSPVSQLHLNHSLHINHAATFEVSFFFFLLLVFLPALPNGLMDRGCIDGTQVCGGSCVLINSLREDVWNASQCEVRSLLCSLAGFIKETAGHSKTPPPLPNPFPMPSYWLVPLVLILHKVMRICACACGTGRPLHFKHWGWWEKDCC